MNSSAVAFGILGFFAFLAVLVWLRPRIGRACKVRRFRRDLAQVDLMLVAWSQSLRDSDRYRDLGKNPEPGGDVAS